MKHFKQLLPRPARLVVAGLALVAVGCSNLSTASQDPDRGTTEAMPSHPTALLVLDLQNDFTHPDGALHGLVAGELERLDVVRNAVRLVRAARRTGVPVVLSPIQVDYDAPTLADGAAPEGIAGAIVSNRAFDAAGSGSDLTAELTPFLDRAGVEVRAKPGLSAFAGTDLDERLAELGVEELVIAGLLTNFCVESTARDAYDLGYRVRVVADASAAFDQAQHEHALEAIFPMLGGTVTTAEFVADPSALVPGA